MTDFDQARTHQTEAADDVETQAILLAVMEERLSTARDDLALWAAGLRVLTPLLGKNAEDREAEFLLRLHANEDWLTSVQAVRQEHANVETQRAALERARMRRQEWLWVMRYAANLSTGTIDEL